MTANNGWPGKPGVPLNPEKDGWHWLIRINGQYPEVWEWASGPAGWCAEYGDKSIGAWCESEGDGQPKEIAKWYSYLGAVLTPDEEQNLRDDLASAERERAHQHGRADCSAAEHAREQAKREALQKRCEEAERERDALRRDALQEIATDELVRRLQHLGDWQAADRIEALQKRVAELEGALRNIEADCGSDCPPSHGAIKYAARAALGGKDE